MFEHTAVRPNTVRAHNGRQHTGWRPDLPDARDHEFRPDNMLLTRHQPAAVRLDRSPAMPPVYDQGRLGSCTANAIAGACEFDLRNGNAALSVRAAGNVVDFMPSRLFIYYGERLIEGDVAQDNGAQIRDGIKTVHKSGICPETLWPYDPAQFAVEPPAAAYASALATKGKSYARVAMNDAAWRTALADGHPIVFGFTVYESFEQIGADGIMPMPTKGEAVVGGHAVCAVGYDTIGGKPVWVIRNSWGSSWAVGGYCYMPALYPFAGFGSDAWIIRTLT